MNKWAGMTTVAKQLLTKMNPKGLQAAMDSMIEACEKYHMALESCSEVLSPEQKRLVLQALGSEKNAQKLSTQLKTILKAARATNGGVFDEEQAFGNLLSSKVTDAMER
eukprot:4076654-Amphidinium_carterae.1